MKRQLPWGLAIIFIIVALLYSLFSCKEDEGPKFCFDCTEKKIETSPSGYYRETEQSTTYCNKTESDAERIRKDGTRSETSGTIIINYSTTCIKQ